MNVLIHGVHFSLSDNTKAYVNEHLVAPLEHILRDSAGEIEVHLVDTNGPKGGEDKECRVTVRLPGLPSVHVEEASASIFQSIDACRDRLETAVKRSRERRRDLHHAGVDRHG